jgi:glycosyltransferase involved in cell wall biosynthesis
MNMSDTISVIIPAYNGTRFLGEAIQSVLNQTYPHFELIVVDDVSTDDTADVVKRFDDPRITYVLHEENRGAIAARYTGSRVAKGEIIAFLDQDDLFHPEKLQAHVNFFTEHPEVGLTHNPRFDLNHSSSSIRRIFRPPEEVSLSDLVLGFPITPSDMVLRREWAVREDIWDDSFVTQGNEAIVNGGEYVFLGRLFLAGCKFANVERVLNYRRYHSGRVFGNLLLRCKSEVTCQDLILYDPRCPVKVFSLRNLAHMNTTFMFGYYALAQEETSLGQELMRKVVRLDPTVLRGAPSRFMRLLLSMCIDDENISHEMRLESVFDQLPEELELLSEQYHWAVTTGYLLKGSRAVIWDRPEDGKTYFERAKELDARINRSFQENLVDQLLSFEAEFGCKAAQDVLHNLMVYLLGLGDSSVLRSLKGLYWFGHAFQNYHKGNYDTVPRTVLKAIGNDLKYLGNRGALAIAVRSFLKSKSVTSHNHISSNLTGPT